MPAGRQTWSNAIGGATEFIRAAEKFIAANNYQLALKQLTVAQRLDPKNNYIKAIIDRVHSLQNEPLSESGDDQRYLSITVGNEFPGGIKAAPAEEPLSPKALQSKVKHLVNMAEKYLEKGSYESAFDSLLKAYLLDPASPYVAACEKTVLPAWQESHRQLQSSDVSSSFTSERFSMPPQHPQDFDAFGQEKPLDHSKPTREQEQRLELLKQQKEAKRRERERTQWREASKPSKVFGQDGLENLSGTGQPKQETEKEEKGLFAKLKRGKFLG